MPSGAQRGRGAVTNPAVRFESSVVSPFDDGWDTLTGEIEEPVKLATTLIKDATKVMPDLARRGCVFDL